MWSRYHTMTTIPNESSEPAKFNWPMICAAVVAGVLVAGLAVAVIAMYVANFNLLEWIE